MTTLVAEPKAGHAGANNGQPASLFSKGVCFSVTKRGWTAKASNTEDDVGISTDEAERRAISTYGTKNLVDPDRIKIFTTLEGKARTIVARAGYRFQAVDSWFVPLGAVLQLTGRLKEIVAKYNLEADRFCQDYQQLKAEWLVKHPALPRGLYPLDKDLRARFSLNYYMFQVSSPSSLVEDVDILSAQAQDDELKNMRAKLNRECNQFVDEYVRNFRNLAAEFCTQVIEQNGEVHGKTLTSIRVKIEKFRQMNIFEDNVVVSQLKQLENQIKDLDGVKLRGNRDAQTALVDACKVIKQSVLDEAAILKVTERQKRRIVMV